MKKALFFLALLLLYLYGGRFIGITWDEPPLLQSSLTLRQSFSHIVHRTATQQDYRELSTIYETPQGERVIGALLFSLFPFLAPLTLLRLFSGLLFCLLLYLGGSFLEKEHKSSFYAFALFLFFSPRLYGHAHIFALDTARLTSEFLSVFFFLKGTQDDRYAYLYGIMQGVAMSFHFSAWLLPFLLTGWGVLARKPIKKQLLSLLMTPIVYYLLNPFLWIDPFRNLFLFLKLNLHRTAWNRVPLYYIGKTYLYTLPYRTPAAYPWHYPFVLFAVTFPTIPMLLLYRFACRKKTLTSEEKLLAVLLFLPLLLLVPPRIPKYDGARLLLPAFLYGTLLAVKAWQSLPRKAQVIFLLLHISEGLLFLQAPLSAYNAFIGWTKGAYQRQFEVTYWSDPLNSTFFTQLERVAKDAKTLCFAGVPQGVIDFWQQKGFLKEKTTETMFLFNKSDIQTCDLLVLYGRFGLFTRTAWNLWKNKKTELVWEREGVPLAKIFLLR